MKKFIGFAATGIIALLCAMIFLVPSVKIETVREDAKVDYGSCETHLYGNNNEYTYVGEATCSSTATKYRTCIVCGFIEKIVIPKDPDNHSNVSDFVTYDPQPTCVSGGVQYKICYACNQPAEVVNLDADPDAHVSLGDYVVVTPETCSTDGEKARKCRYCQEYFDNTPIPADTQKHVVGENATWHVTKLPTCFVSGEMIAYCELCGVKAETRVVPATDRHIPAEEWTVDIEPTCSAEGLKSRHCTVCDISCDRVVLPMESDKHTFDAEFTTDKKATCIEEGSKSKHCIYCGEKTEDTVIEKDPEAHAYSDEWVVTKEPDCTDSGLKHKVCTLCKKNSVATIIEKKSHTYPETYDIVRMSEDELSAIVKYICEDCGYEYETVIVFGQNNGNGNIGDSSTDTDDKVFEIIPVDNTVIKVDHNKFIISNVARHMLVDEFVSKFKNGSAYAIFNEKGEFKDEAEYIGTGCRLNFETVSGNVTNYYVSVTGDIDSDGKITASDARLVLRAAARLDALDGAYFTAADVNLDDKVTAADARKTLLVAANIEYFDSTYEH